MRCGCVMLCSVVSATQSDLWFAHYFIPSYGKPVRRTILTKSNLFDFILLIVYDTGEWCMHNIRSGGNDWTKGKRIFMWQWQSTPSYRVQTLLIISESWWLKPNKKSLQMLCIGLWANVAQSTQTFECQLQHRRSHSYSIPFAILNQSTVCLCRATSIHTFAIPLWWCFYHIARSSLIALTVYFVAVYLKWKQAEKTLFLIGTKWFRRHFHTFVRLFCRTIAMSRWFDGVVDYRKTVPKSRPTFQLWYRKKE